MVSKKCDQRSGDGPLYVLRLDGLDGAKSSFWVSTATQASHSAVAHQMVGGHRGICPSRQGRGARAPSVDFRKCPSRRVKKAHFQKRFRNSQKIDFLRNNAKFNLEIAKITRKTSKNRVGKFWWAWENFGNSAPRGKILVLGHFSP